MHPVRYGRLSSFCTPTRWELQNGGLQTQPAPEVLLNQHVAERPGGNK